MLLPLLSLEVLWQGKQPRSDAGPITRIPSHVGWMTLPWAQLMGSMFNTPAMKQ